MVVEGERRIDTDTISIILLILFLTTGFLSVILDNNDLLYITFSLGAGAIILAIAETVRFYKRETEEFRKRIRQARERRRRIMASITEAKRELVELEELLNEVKNEKKRRLARLRKEYEEIGKRYLAELVDDDENNKD